MCLIITSNSDVIEMYIWQQSNWPHFTWDSARLATLLAGARHRQGLLLGRLNGLGFDLRQEATLTAMTQEVVKTSEIEGEALDPAQVRSSLARRLGIEQAAVAPAERNVEGIVEVMIDATRNYDKPLTAERLHGWQAALFPTGFSGMERIAVGRWRDDSQGPMRVVSGAIGQEKIHYQAPPAAHVGRDMDGFLEWFGSTSKDDPVIRCAVAHLWFVTIHPFDDGNGRLARAIGEMALARAEQTTQRFYSVSAQIRAERTAYHDILEATQKDTLDVTAWLEWFLGCYSRALSSAEKTLDGVLRKARFLARTTGLNLNDRQKKVLGLLLDGVETKVTTGKWRFLTNASAATAFRDIDHLVELGLISKNEGAHGRSTSYSLVNA